MHRNARILIPVFVRYFGLPLVVASIDLAVVIQALEFLPEPVATLADMPRVLRGRFRLTNLIAIGHNANAGIAGRELNP